MGFLNPSGQMLESYLDQTTTTSLNILPNLSFTNHLIIPIYINAPFMYSYAPRADVISTTLHGVNEEYLLEWRHFPEYNNISSTFYAMNIVTICVCVATDRVWDL
jgi:hypothetical protein